MRFFAPIFVWLVAAACVQAQGRFSDYPDSPAMQRLDSSTKKAINAVNAHAAGKPISNDSTMASSFVGKKFEGAGFSTSGKTDGTSAFRYDQKFTAQKYEASRTFFGIKNPWFGRKTFDTGDPSRWSKSLYGSDKKYPVGGAQTKKAYQSDKKVDTSQEVVETKPYLGQPEAQGTVSLIKDKITKEMSIEEVRELLNKNR